MIWYKIYEPDDNDYGTWTGKTGLNPDRGRVRGNLCGTSYLGRFA
jgi:hypothetical protein